MPPGQQAWGVRGGLGFSFQPESASCACRSQRGQVAVQDVALSLEAEAASCACRFVRSVVSKQAGGTNYSASSLNQCNPEIYEGRTPNASKPQNGVISPCGLIAWSLFNDTFAATQGTTALNIDVSAGWAALNACSSCHTASVVCLGICRVVNSLLLPPPGSWSANLTLALHPDLIITSLQLWPSSVPSAEVLHMCLQTQDISWAYDREHLYGNYQAQNFNDEAQYRGGGTITQNVSQAENLLVWMKPAAYHTFKKLYGRIDQPLLAGGSGTRLLCAVSTTCRATLGSHSLIVLGPETGLCNIKGAPAVAQGTDDLMHQAVPASI